MVNPTFDAYQNLGELVTDAMLMPAWSPDGKVMGFVSGPADDRRAWRVDLESGQKTELYDTERLRAAVTKATGVTPSGRGAPFAHFGFVGPNTIAFAVGADQLTVDLDQYEAHLAPKPSQIDAFMGSSEQVRRTPRPFTLRWPLMGSIEAQEVTSPDGQWLLSTQNHNIALRSGYDGRSVTLTDDGAPQVEWTFDWSNQALAAMGMGVPTTNWSPQSDRIVVYKLDNRGVAQLARQHFLKRYDETLFVNGTIAGGVLETATVHILDVASRQTTQIDLGDTRNTYPVAAGWLPDGSGLVIFQMSRDCSRVDIKLADPATGACRPLFTEQNDTFVRIHHDVYYGRKLGLWLTPDGQNILWLSDRDGYMHIYKYDLDGKLVGQLTSGAWPVDQVSQVLGDHVYFTAHTDQKRPYDLHFCRVPLAGGAMEQLTGAPGKHHAMLAPNGQVFLDTHSAPDREPATELRTLGGAVLNAEVNKADISKLKEVGFTAPEEFVVKAADGVTDLWGVMYKPHDFDPKKKYPLIEYIYGGPQLAVAEHAFPSLMGAMAMRLAQLGCITVMLDARGTPERGRVFHNAIYRDWAGALVADHAGAIKQLAERHDFIDGERVGITGGSWGGYASSRCLIEAPDVYKAAVSQSPGYDPYSSVLYECYLGMPQKNPDAYQAANILALAPKLERPLMIACGTADQMCWRDAMQMSEALVRAGKDYEFVAMPDQGHGFDSVHQTFYMRKLAEFFGKHLQFDPGLA
jgi:dipeptidyl aminopeptidase/acylaminoacyl peptidase